MNTHDSRRTFLKTLGLVIGTLAVAPVLKMQNVFAAEAKKAKGKAPAKAAAKSAAKAPADAIDPKTNVTAKALGYVHDANLAKDRTNKKSHCGDCNYYLGGSAPYGKCQLITGGEVSAAGWCRSWSAKA